AKPNNEYPFAVLRNEVLRIDHMCVDIVSEVIAQCAHDNFKRSTLVVGFQVLNILEQESSRPFRFENPCDVEEQSPLRFAHEPVLEPQGVLFANAGDRERLARESREQHIVIRDFRRCDFCYVTSYFMIDMEVFLISLKAILVPLARVDAPPTSVLKGQTTAP